MITVDFITYMVATVGIVTSALMVILVILIYRNDHNDSSGQGDKH